MRIVLEKRSEASTLMAISSPFIALGITVILGGNHLRLARLSIRSKRSMSISSSH